MVQRVGNPGQRPPSEEDDDLPDVPIWPEPDTDEEADEVGAASPNVEFPLRVQEFIDRDTGNSFTLSDRGLHPIHVICDKMKD